MITLANRTNRQKIPARPCRNQHLLAAPNFLGPVICHTYRCPSLPVDFALGNKHVKRLSYALLILMLAPVCQAAMVLDRSILTFAADKAPREDVTVHNPDAEPMFVEVEVLEVRAPGTDKEERIVVRNPEEIGLIATPRRLVVPAGGSRVVRLVNLAGHGATERVYRVNVKPVAAPEDGSTGGETKKSMSIKILIAYQLLIFVNPEKTEVLVDGHRDGTTLQVQNKGNVNAYLYDGRQCKEGETKEQCATLQGLRLYPGNVRSLTLPRDQAVDFMVEADGRHTSTHFD